MGNIILVGFPGAGKDTVGKILARKTGYKFLSTDTLIQLEEGKTINEIFKQHGEKYFRDLEKNMLLKIKDIKNAIVSTGGGMPLKKQNRDILKSMGKVVNLYISKEVAKKRLKFDRARPLISKAPEQTIEKLFEQRKGLYDFADLSIDTSYLTPSSAADKIISGLALKSISVIPYLSTITIHTPGKKYPVYIGCGLIHEIGRLLAKAKCQPHRAGIITNPLPGAFYLEPLMMSLKKYKITCKYFIIPDGEEHKNLQTAKQIYDFLAREKFDRTDLIIALGGGVIGDLSGFVASTYKRGTLLIQIPTTIVAQVDASIGGKTGIDTAFGKNIIGTFYQPDMVVVDIETLLTLPEGDYRDGLAEVIKYGIIKDRSLFLFLAKERDKILSRDISLLCKVIPACIKIKKEVVEKDEREQKGIREILNYGHTIGHIIETLTDYHGYKHNRAVAIGMVAEAEFSSNLGILKKEEAIRIRDLISAYGLPSKMPSGIPKKAFIKVVCQDKKIRGDKIKMPFLIKIGDARVKTTPLKLLLNNFLHQTRGSLD